MILRHWWARPVAFVVAAALFLVQTKDGLAGAFEDAAGSGKALGQQFLQTGKESTLDSEGNIVLWPEDSSKTSILNTREIFGGTVDDLQDVRNLYGDESELTSAGSSKYEDLKDDPSGSGSGGAVDVVLSTRSLSRPDLTTDPVWTQTDTVFNDWEAASAEFGDCSKQTTFFKSKITSHLAEYRYCTRASVPNTTKEIKHTLEAGVIRHKSGPLNLSSCGDGCMQMWIGTVGDNYLEGNCKIFEEQLSVEVINTDAIISATLDYAKWDDYFQVYLNDARVYAAPNSNFPPETSGACELNTNWETTPNINVTTQFKQEGALNFRTRTSVTGNGEGYARITIYYDRTKVVMKDEWSPEISDASDGFCKTEAVCTAQYPLNANGCTIMEGIAVCPDMLAPAPAGLSPLCKEATIKFDCDDFLLGQMDCWTDIDGEQQCPVVATDARTDCTKYEENPECGFISSSCVEGALGASGTCYLNAETWDCGHDVEVETVDTSTQLDCVGEVRCQGADCVQPTYETNDDFASAVAALSAIKYMGLDTTCTETTGTENVTCDVFVGEPYECKKAVGGYVDCCNGAEITTTLQQYMDMIDIVTKADDVYKYWTDESFLKSTWSSIKSVFSGDTWSAIQSEFTAPWNNLWDSADSSSITDVFDVFDVIDEVKTEIVNQAAEWTMEVFGPEVGEMLFVQNAAGNYVLGGVIGSALNFIMMAYAVYQIITMIIKMVFKCETKEFELQAKQELRACHYLGTYCKTSIGVCIEQRESYCCFASPLSRILQEQVRSQLNISWGTAKEPQCQGLTTADLERVNWETVDLSEWTGILTETNHMVSVDDIDVESLTGTGSTFAVDGERNNVIERTTERIEGIDVEAVRRTASEELHSTNE